MVNTIQRRFARQVAETTGALPPQPADMHDKAYLYGLFAMVVSQIDFSTSLRNSFEFPPQAITELTDASATLMSKLAFDVVKANPELDEEFQVRIKSRARARKWDVQSANARERFKSGAETARVFETITLRTIQQRVEAGQTITRKGLHDSYRVPYRFAMQHILDLCHPTGECYKTGGYYPDGRLQRSWTEDFVGMYSASGLFLHGEPPVNEPIIEELAFAEPTVGCPVTLIKGFMRDFHVLNADAAVEYGILQVSD